MRFPARLLLASATLIALCSVAKAQAIFSTGANVPVGAYFYRGSGGVIDTATSYARPSSPSLGTDTSFEGGNFPLSSTFQARVDADKPGGVTLNTSMRDGSSDFTDIYGNLYLQFFTTTSDDFAQNAFQARYTFPQTVSGLIGFIGYYDVVTGSTTSGFASAFDYAFDGAGSIIITPNGSFTATENELYYLALNLAVVPEPASAALVLSVLAGGLVASRRRRRA